jgi:hypothetical protein
MTNEINNRAEQIGNSVDNGGAAAARALFDDAFSRHRVDERANPTGGGCFGLPKDGASDGGRSVTGKDLEVQPGEKTNKIEERPRIIVCPGEGPNPAPTRHQDAHQQLNQRLDQLMQDLKRPVVRQR